MPLTRSQGITQTPDADKGKQKMAASDTGEINPTDPQAAEAEILANQDPNRLLLLNIIANQKTSEEQQEKRFSNLDKLIQASKTTLETHIAENDKVIGTIRSNVETNTKDVKAFQDEVKTMKNDLAELQQKYDESQLLLNKTTTILAEFTKTVNKLDVKYNRDEEENMRCQLIIDGAKEQGRPKIIVVSLLKDLGVEFVEADIRSAYRLGPVNEKSTRPRSIKVQFVSNKFKYDIYKNIQKLKGKEQWQGVHISDAVSQDEQEKRRDMRCIFAVGKARSIDIKLRGSNIIIDGIKYGHSDINDLPKGLSIKGIKVVATKDGTAFQSHHAYLSNMYPCKIVYEGLEYKSSEHLYFAEMARHHNKFELAEEIRNTKDGYAAKRASKEIIVAEDWEQIKVKIMKKVIHLKFDQNPGLRDELLTTKGFLYEATKGDSFSCGLSLPQAKDIDQASITKGNQLGIILVEYRDEYLGLTAPN